VAPRASTLGTWAHRAGGQQSGPGPAACPSHRCADDLGAESAATASQTFVSVRRSGRASRVLMGLIPILVACALDFDPRNSLNMGVMFFSKRASAAQIGMTLSAANIPDLHKLEPALEAVAPLQRPGPGQPVKRPAKLHADKVDDAR